MQLGQHRKQLTQQHQNVLQREGLAGIQQGLQGLPLLPGTWQPEGLTGVDQIPKARQLGMQDPLELKPALAQFLPLLLRQFTQDSEMGRRIGSRLIQGQPAVVRQGALQAVATADQRSRLQTRIVFHQRGSGRALRLLQTFALQPLTVIKP